MENITKINWINKTKVNEVAEDTTLDKMIMELKEDSKKYREENKIFYKNINEQLAEIKGLVKYTLSEQEKQRIASMSIGELLVEMKSLIDDVSLEMKDLRGAINNLKETDKVSMERDR